MKTPCCRNFLFSASMLCALLISPSATAQILVTTSTTIGPATRALNSPGATEYRIADSATLTFLNSIGATGTDGGVFAYNGSATYSLMFAPDGPVDAESGLPTGSGEVVFQNNTADKHGGAIGITNNRATLTLVNATFALNRTGSGNGGALITNGTSRIHDSLFISNTAGASGGAFYGTGHAVITRTGFDGNRAATTGGAIYRSGNTLVFSGGTFSHNIAGTNGGALYNTGANTVSAFDDAVFSSNQANAGGALYVNSGTVTATRARFEGNIAASSHGGAVYASTAAVVVLTDVTFSENASGGNGGAIYTNRGTFTIRATTSATSAGNKASGTTNTTGGFLYVTGSDAVVNFDITGTTTRYVIGDADAADRTLDTIASGGSGLAATNPLITKTGNGALVLNADNSAYRGHIVVNEGALLLGNTNAALNAATHTINGGALGGLGTISGALDFHASSTLFVGDSLTIITTETTGATLRDGATIGGSGTLIINGENNTLNLDAGAIATNVTATETLVITAALSGAGALEKHGAGTLHLSNTASTFTGGVTLVGGTLALSDTAQLGDPANEIRFASASAAALRIDADNQILANTFTLAAHAEGGIDTQAHTLSLRGALTADVTATLTKTGAGALIIDNGAGADMSTFAGTLRAEQGVLVLADVDLTGNVDATNGATLRASNPGAAASSTLVVVGTLALDDSTLAFTLHGGMATDGFLASDRIYAAALAATGANTIDIGGVMRSGTYNLGNLAALAPTARVTVDGAEQLPDFRRKAAIVTSGSLFLLEAQIDMSRALAWTGGTGATANLWTGNHAGQWTDTGTVTRFADGDRVTFSGAPTTIDIPASVTVSDMIVAGSATTTFSGEGIIADAASVVTGTLTDAAGRLHKSGAGTLVFENATNTFRGGITLDEGTIVFARAEQLGDGGNGIAVTGDATLSLAASGAETELPAAITIASGKTVTLDTIADSTLVLRNTISGSGALTKTGVGALALAASADYKGGTTIRAGTLRADAPNVLPRESPFTLHANATLDLAGHDQTIAALAARGTLNLRTARLSIAGDYVASNAILQLNIVLSDTVAMRAGTLVISGSASGQTDVRIQLTDTRAQAARAPLPADAPALITTTIANAGNAFTLENNQRFVVGAYDYLLLPDNAVAAREWRLVLDNFSPEIPAVAGTDAIAFQSGRAAFDTLLARLDELRLSPNADVRGYDLWADAMYRRDRVNQTVYTGASIAIAGVQAGAGFVHKKEQSTFRLGVFADVSSAGMNLSRGSKTDADIRGAGLYAAFTSRAWQFDLIARGATADYDIKAPGTATFSTDGNDFGATIQAGYSCETKSGWVIKPQAALSFQRHSVDDTTDTFGRIYKVDDFTSLAARLAVSFNRAYQLRRGVLIPRVRASVTNEFDAESRVTIADDSIETDLGGLGAELDAGLTWVVDKRWTFSAAVTARAGSKFDGYTLRLGARCAW